MTPEETEVIIDIRREFIMAGYDTEKFTDQEIKDGFIRFGILLAETGLTAKEAARALIIQAEIAAGFNTPPEEK